MFDEATQDWIRANPEQLSYSELAIRFSTSRQTIIRVIRQTGAYKQSVAEEVV